MQQIIVYTIGCPQCNVLEKKLQQNNIPYLTINDEAIFKELGIEQFPMMKIGQGALMTFKQANDWIKKWGCVYGKH